MNFDDLGLSAPILHALKEKGYTQPTAIQSKAIPVILEGKDLMAAAQTGTGKTAGFTLPILQILAKGARIKGNATRCLILTPTRELAAQIDECVQTYSTRLPLRSTVTFGGVNIRPQITTLKKGTDILIATPGRLLDLYKQGAISFDFLDILVLDEADRMLDMGFINDIKRIIDLLPKLRQNLLFSATFSEPIRKLAKTLVNDPVEISVDPKNSTAITVDQAIYEVNKLEKPSLLVRLISDNNWKQVLVFTKTKHGANRLSKRLESEGIQSAAIHGNKSQSARTQALANFKKGEIRVLVATDIAARGIDINNLPRVINYDLPAVPEDYVHRIGRTGRAGVSGKAISLVSEDDIKILPPIERLIKHTLKRLDIPPFIAKEEIKEPVVPQKTFVPRDMSKVPNHKRSAHPRANAPKKKVKKKYTPTGFKKES
jgi:ATP-dependent RNA helicase RhlE